MKKVIDKTYITRSGKDIRDSKMPGTFKVNISENNQRIADKRIEIAQKAYADLIHHGQFYARKLIKK